MRIHLRREDFQRGVHRLVEDGPVSVELSRYSTGVESLTVTTSRGQVVVLPYLGQMVWDAEFDGVDLTMLNMFDEPRPAEAIVDTYGCFAFHSGLLANGCPSPQDSHPLHGEMPCAVMDSAWIEVSDEGVTIGGQREYAQGFGHHYLAEPAVTVLRDHPAMRIEMAVTNLSRAAQMPLQYMCHTNHAYLPGGRFVQNIPASAIKARESVPAHVRPTPGWTAYNDELVCGTERLEILDRPELYDPEIVFFADDLPSYGENMVFELMGEEGTTFFTEFCAQQFPVATRWILHNADQQVAAFVLPGTSRPEGYLAAEAAGTLVRLAPGECREFSVLTGLRG